ncbi:nuclear transport factor 2 family protein [Sphingorhabdus sp.]|uniref:nuclear transport factor 2 family protein n=1 Tax=Sphingorhabdus sp. TaxID=1902408 RepID=UPI0038FC625E
MTVESEVLAAEQSRREALIADDMAAFALLISDDVTHVHTTGIVQGKGALLGHAGTFLRFIDIERHDLKVRAIDENHAIMTGGMTNTVARRGHEERVEVQAFVTQVWELHEGRWQIVNFHATRLPPPTGE